MFWTLTCGLQLVQKVLVKWLWRLIFFFFFLDISRLVVSGKNAFSWSGLMVLVEFGHLQAGSRSGVLNLIHKGPEWLQVSDQPNRLEHLLETKMN